VGIYHRHLSLPCPWGDYDSNDPADEVVNRDSFALGCVNLSNASPHTMTSYRQRRSTAINTLIGNDILATLTESDITVLRYLDKLMRNSGGEACTASIPKIALACAISERQVQISTSRLIEAKLLSRVGYDFGNPNKTKRGSIYKVLSRENKKHSR
jgi:hypothetical protein